MRSFLPGPIPGVSLITIKIGTGLYFIVMAMISSAIGGYLAGLLRTKWVGVQAPEVHFRDTAHGFLHGRRHPLSVPYCRSPASSLVGGTLAGATKAQPTPHNPRPMNDYVDTLLRSDKPSASKPTELA